MPLVNKTAFLESQLALKGYNIVAVTESHLDATILDAELFPPNHVVYRKDRNRKGGGVLLAVRDEILPTRRNCDANTEILWVDILYGKNKSFTFGVFYRPPNNSIEPLVDLSASLDEFNDSAEIVLVSDFNLPDIDWTTNSVVRESDLNCKLKDILLDHLMSQQVLEPTRGRNILDLVITTNEGLIRNLQVGEPFSDHNSIVFEVKISSSKYISRKKVYKFTKANLDRLNELFNFVPCIPDKWCSTKLANA